MKFLFCIAFSFATMGLTAQTKTDVSVKNPKNKVQVVEASCGTCNFNMKGAGCLLAVRINGKAYFVDGTSLDDHGDAHAEDGFCEVIRKAEVQGSVVNDRFKVTYFKLLKPEVQPELKEKQHH